MPTTEKMYFNYATKSVVFVVCLILIGACSSNGTTVNDQTGEPEGPVVQKWQAGAVPVQIDMLWVIGSDGSMCEEQMALPRAFSAAVEFLGRYLDLDLRVAVVSADLLGNQGAGKFADFGSNTQDPEGVFNSNCLSLRVFTCGANQDCEDAFGKGWTCDLHDELEGSVGDFCRATCTADDPCEDYFCSELDTCTFKCSTGGCSAQANLALCTGNPGDILTGEDLDLFRCNALVGNHATSPDAGLAAAWLALDPQGPNQSQSARFLRDEAYLVVVFLSDEDDCSIDEEFAAPSFTCEDDSQCPGLSKCETMDLGGEEKKVCKGAIKEEYHQRCSMLGEYRGLADNACAYDSTCEDCASDQDCEQGWYCAGGKKCRPLYYSFAPYASFQEPFGAPLFPLTPKDLIRANLLSLKTDPNKVIVASISGDGIVLEGDRESQISDWCLGGGSKDSDPELMGKCKDYKEFTDTTSLPEACLTDPTLPELCLKNADLLDKCKPCLADAAACAGREETPGECENNRILAARCSAISEQFDACLTFASLKRECIRQCYLQTMGDNNNPIMRKSAYICNGTLGTAGLGSRYLKLAESFGANGLTGNLCSEAGFEPILLDLAHLIATRTTRICLTRLLSEGESVSVSIFQGESETASRLLTEGPGPEGDYLLDRESLDCCLRDSEGACTAPGQAIIFNYLPAPDYRFEITYPAEADSAI